ncbi:uncharacterized protein [Erythrolamprus reginae]|uniref:uncharacterized protein n=1 Tax=Erythrolamprus reginae TaxID=121349 RepID=UPI00396C4EE2
MLYGSSEAASLCSLQNPESPGKSRPPTIFSFVTLPVNEDRAAFFSCWPRGRGSKGSSNTCSTSAIPTEQKQPATKPELTAKLLAGRSSRSNQRANLSGGGGGESAGETQHQDKEPFGCMQEIFPPFQPKRLRRCHESHEGSFLAEFGGEKDSLRLLSPLSLPSPPVPPSHRPRSAGQIRGAGCAATTQEEKNMRHGLSRSPSPLSPSPEWQQRPAEKEKQRAARLCLMDLQEPSASYFS